MKFSNVRAAAATHLNLPDSGSVAMRTVRNDQGYAFTKYGVRRFVNDLNSATT